MAQPPADPYSAAWRPEPNQAVPWRITASARDGTPLGHVDISARNAANSPAGLCVQVERQEKVRNERARLRSLLWAAEFRAAHAQLAYRRDGAHADARPGAALSTSQYLAEADRRVQELRRALEALR
jgi:hypothetical protein